MRSHIGWGGERSILYKGWKPLPSRHVLQRRILKTWRDSPKRTIFTSGGLRLLHCNLVNDQLAASLPLSADIPLLNNLFFKILNTAFFS